MRTRHSAATGEFQRADRAAQFLLRKTKRRPGIALVLGSGLGDLAAALRKPVRVEYRAIPGFAAPTVAGHAGRVVIGTLEDSLVCVLQGRIHLYEGYSAREVGFPIRVLARMGIRTVILTNSAGGIRADLAPGCIVVLRDHINLQGESPLGGAHDERLGPRFCDLSSVYCGACRELALREGRRLGLPIAEGVYAAVRGPNYETPAEIRYLRAIGADVVGMSTVPEAIVAAQLGLRVLALSCVTNMAAGIADQPLTHEEVLETASQAANGVAALLRAVIPQMEGAGS